MVANICPFIFITLMATMTLGCPREDGMMGYQCEGPEDEESPCIPVNQVCDIKPDCPSGDDETDCLDRNITRKLIVQSVKLEQPMDIEEIDIDHFEVYDPSTDVTRYQQPPIPFIAYKRSNPGESFDAKTVVYGESDRIVVYVHGYATSKLDDGRDIKNGLFEGTLDVDWVVIIDWRKWSLPYDDASPAWPTNYKIVALQNVPIVADRIKEWLVETFVDSNYVYFLGYSLGAHISGTAARNSQLVDRITGMDPAGPIFEYSLYGVYPVVTTNALRPSDASFIDILHGSINLGINNEAGHLDIYLKENKCSFWDSSCIHRMTLELYISSLTRCSQITCPEGKSCGPSTFSEYGYLADKYGGRGRHKLTVETSYFGWSDEECSQFRNVYLKPKDRVCHDPPNELDESSHCVDKPYLTICAINCGDFEIQLTCSIAGTAEWEGDVGGCYK